MKLKKLLEVKSSNKYKYDHGSKILYVDIVEPKLVQMKKPFKGFSNCHETILTKRGVYTEGRKVSTREEKKIYWIDLRMPLQVCVSNFVPGN